MKIQKASLLTPRWVGGGVRVAAEVGDHDEELDCHHLEMKQYVPNQEYLDHKIIKFHKRHR